MKTFRKTLFAVALTAGIFTSFPALAENCVKPNLGGLSYRQMQENYPNGTYECAYRNVLAAKNADGNWVYLDNKTGKTLFTLPAHMTFIGHAKSAVYKNGIDIFLDYGLIASKNNNNYLLTDNSGKVIFTTNQVNDIGFYIFPKSKTILTVSSENKIVFYHFDGHQLSTFNPAPQGNIFVVDDPTGVKTRKAYAERFEKYLEELISNNELIPVIERDKHNEVVGGYIDLLGNVVIPLEHHRLGDFSEGLVVASDPENSKFLGYLNKTGKLVIPYEYTSGKMFNKGAARVCQGDDCFYINKQGKKVADPNQKKATTSKKQSNKKQSSGKSAAAGAVAGGVVGGIKGGIIGGVIGAIVGD